MNNVLGKTCSQSLGYDGELLGMPFILGAPRACRTCEPPQFNSIPAAAMACRQ